MTNKQPKAQSKTWASHWVGALPSKTRLKLFLSCSGSDEVSHCTDCTDQQRGSTSSGQSLCIATASRCEPRAMHKT